MRLTAKVEVIKAAKWLATTPKNQLGGPALQVLKDRFGLEQKDALEAMAEAVLIKSRSL